MIQLKADVKIFVSLLPTDMRKSINGLSALVVDDFSETPQSGHVFLFYNKKKDKVKAIYWDRNGFVLHYKRLDRGRFKLSAVGDNDVIEVSEQQLQWLLAGLDFQLMQEFNEIDYTHYY